MRLILLTLIWLGTFAAARAAEPVAGRIVKVLPFLLDAQGRDSTTPSLFDRDAYQAQLREHTNNIHGYRIDVLWKAEKAAGEKIKLRVELRGIGANSLPTEKVFETVVTPGTFRRWTKFTLFGDDYKKIGSVVAWRATLWNGNKLLGEQKSFLW